MIQSDQSDRTEEISITKLVHGGQGLGQMADGRKVFVWGVLPGEVVHIRVIKRKRSYLEAIATDIIKASPLRQSPREPNYLATSPWQIMPLITENEHKKAIVQELFTQAHIAIPDFDIAFAGPEWQYRNKMEYSFWGDEVGLHLALHNRGSHLKQIVKGSVLAMPAIDAAANQLLEQLRRLGVRAGDLKTVILRCSQAGEAVGALFVKTETFPKIELPATLKGLRVYFSNPKSPASVLTRQLADYGDSTLHDMLLGEYFTYDVDSFFQVNLPIFERALADIKKWASSGELVDMYAGVGSIGLSVATGKVDLVESDAATAAMARANAASSRLEVQAIEAPSEVALDYIVSDKTVIFDPPRAGLHDKVVARVLAAKPPRVIYLSCNPATQARDLAKMHDEYNIVHFAGYNFFPHTPHIETLAVLERN